MKFKAKSIKFTLNIITSFNICCNLRGLKNCTLFLGFQITFRDCERISLSGRIGVCTRNAGDPGSTLGQSGFLQWTF